MADAIRAISLQRVQMRNEMFCQAMTDQELDAFMAAREQEIAAGATRPA